MGAMKRLRSRLYQRLVRLLPRTAKVVRERLGRRFRRFPAILSVELTNRCNAACIMCPRQYMTRPKGWMSVALYERILEEARAFSSWVRLFQPFLFGEALLHPDFVRLIRLTRERLPTTKIYLSTNGCLLDEERATAILEARVDKVNIDIDGTTPEVAEKIRRNTKLELVRRNVQAFIAKRNRTRGRTKIRVSIIRMPENAHQIEDFMREWSPLADHVQIVDFNNWLGVIEDTQPDLAVPFDFPCRHPYEELAIAWDGRATLCCLDFDLRHPVGQLPAESIKDIWNGRVIEWARSQMEANRYEALPICRGCNAAKFQQHQLWRFLWQVRR